MANTDWLRGPKCGSKTRTMVRTHTVLEDFPLLYVFCFKKGHSHEFFESPFPEKRKMGQV